MSKLAEEAGETAAGARRQLAAAAAVLAELAGRLRARPPGLVVTCARGSSDHAATYGKYLIETSVGRLVASVGPSVASLYARTPSGLEGALFVVVSQSGRSPDLLGLTAAARRAGALVVGVVNDETSPVAAACELVLPMCAGPERAVAATKSHLLGAFALLQLTAAWSGDAALGAAAARLPAALEAAAALDWRPGLGALAGAHSLYVLGRGVGLGAAQEVALKLKETCALHAEAFSSAELLHGPLALVRAGFPILALGQDDETADAQRAVLARLAALGAALHGAGSAALPVLPGLPPAIAPLCQLMSFYLALPELARARGRDPDAPAHLAKITETV